MAKLLYSVITSLDGYVVDESGSFDWAAPDEEAHAFINDLERPVGTYLYGRRLYDVMRYWATAPTTDDASDVGNDFARLWRAADKVVYSTTLDAVDTPRTRLERSFEAGEVAAMKRDADRDLSVGGPGLAASALGAGLVDEVSVFLTPVVVGGGTSYLPQGIRLDLEQLDERRFSSGVVYLRYAVKDAQ